MPRRDEPKELPDQAEALYLRDMDEDLRDMDEDRDNTRPPPVAWAEALERSRAALAAGRTVALSSFLTRLDERIAKAEAQQREATGTAAEA